MVTIIFKKLSNLHRVLWTAGLILTLSLQAYAGQPLLNDIRKQFFAIIPDSCSALKIFESIKADDYQSATLRAYAGATEAASAECVKGAFTKLEYFSRGKKNIEKAIEQQPENTEIRFVRFATQTNLPGFIEYNNIREDKAFIMERLPDLIESSSENWVWLEIAKFMINSDGLKKDERRKLDQLLKNNKHD